MKKTTPIVKTNSKRNFMFHLPFHFFSVVVLLFFLVLKQTSFVSQSNIATAFDTSSTILAPQAAAELKFTAFHFPFELNFAQQVKEAPDENDLEEDFEEDCAYTDESYTSSSLASVYSACSSILDINNALHKRISIPFFILYHSWKSYIA